MSQVKRIFHKISFEMKESPLRLILLKKYLLKRIIFLPWSGANVIIDSYVTLYNSYFSDTVQPPTTCCLFFVITCCWYHGYFT